MHLREKCPRGMDGWLPARLRLPYRCYIIGRREADLVRRLRTLVRRRAPEGHETPGQRNRPESRGFR